VPLKLKFINLQILSIK